MIMEIFRRYTTPFCLKRFSPLLIGLAVIAAFVVEIGPATPGVQAATTVFEVKDGDGFRAIVANLAQAGLIRSVLATETLAAITGRASHLQPGLYRLSATMSTLQILDQLSAANGGEVTVTVPEGSSIVHVDEILSEALVIPKGALLAFAKGSSSTIEGRLFPDTYRFFTNAPVGAVVGRMTENFDEKAGPVLAKDQKNKEKDLVVASIVEKEVPDPEDQKVVAGILWKRLAAGMPLQADATLCYMKLPAVCYPLTALDKRTDSPYNTYLYKGLPPTPIGNPGMSAITAAVQPKSSPYWYYLSDPNTGKTIFAKTLDEQNQNRVKYLK